MFVMMRSQIDLISVPHKTKMLMKIKNILECTLSSVFTYMHCMK